MWKTLESYGKKTRLARIKSKSWIDLPVNLVLGFELAVQAERWHAHGTRECWKANVSSGMTLDLKLFFWSLALFFNCPSFQPAVWWLDSLAAMCWNSLRWDLESLQKWPPLYYLVSKHTQWAGVWELCRPVFFTKQAQTTFEGGGQGVHLFRGCLFLAQPQFCQSLHDSSNVACEGACQMMLGAINL